MARDRRKRKTRGKQPSSAKPAKALKSKPPKIGSTKSRKKIGRTKTADVRPRPKSVSRRLKIALTRVKRGKRLMVTRPSRHSARPTRRVVKVKPSSKRAIMKQPKRARASMRFFSNGKAVRAKVSRKTASTIGSYLTSVRRLLDTNDPEPLEQFAGKSVKDVRGNVFPLETRSNVLYRLNAVVEPFEVYRLIA